MVLERFAKKLGSFSLSLLLSCGFLAISSQANAELPPEIKNADLKTLGQASFGYMGLHYLSSDQYNYHYNNPPGAFEQNVLLSSWTIQSYDDNPQKFAITLTDTITIAEQGWKPLDPIRYNSGSVGAIICYASTGFGCGQYFEFILQNLSGRQNGVVQHFEGLDNKARQFMMTWDGTAQIIGENKFRSFIFGAYVTEQGDVWYYMR